MPNQITTPEQQAEANNLDAAAARKRSLDASNTNLESGTGKFPVKRTASAEEIAAAEAQVGAPAIVGPLADQDPIAAQVAIVDNLPDDHTTPEAGLPAAETPGKPKGRNTTK